MFGAAVAEYFSASIGWLSLRMENPLAALDPSSLWSDHPVAVVVGGAAILLQAALISTLLIHRAKRLRVEEALRVSEERYRAVVDSQSEMVCRYRPDATLTFVNEAYCRFFGKSREELLGRSFLSLVPESRHRDVMAVVRSLVETRQPILHEHEVLRPDGTAGWMEWQDVTILDEKGQVQELQGIGRDITVQRRAADALADAERNLAHATRLALVGELTASIAHEINQPLGAILSNAEAAEIYLARGALEEVRRILADIRKDDLRASEVIQHVRSLVRKDTAAFTAVEVNKVVKLVFGIVAADARRRGVTLVSDLGEALPPVHGERIQLKQALLNLIINAMDAISDLPLQERQVVVRTQRTQRTVEIAVSDQGPGVPPERLAHIFESFFTTKPHGMGLGLAMVRSIAEFHRGRVEVQNRTDGPGATFSLHLPAYGAQKEVL